MSQYRKLLTYIGISVFFHIIPFLSINPNVTKKDNTPVDIEVVPDKKKSSNSGSEGLGPGDKGKSDNVRRIGSDGSGLSDLPLDQRSSAENYIERIKSLIEPPWIRLVRERIQFRNKMRLNKISCTSGTLILISNTGYIESVKLLDSCLEDRQFDNIAIESWNRNIPPPPKNLLIQNKLELYWKFVIL